MKAATVRHETDGGFTTTCDWCRREATFYVGPPPMIEVRRDFDEELRMTDHICFYCHSELVKFIANAPER